MLNKFRTRVILLMLGSTILSIVLVSIIVNVTVLNRFNSYMKSEQQNTINDVVKLVEDAYKVNNGWSEEAVRYIQASPLISNFDIVIKDANNRVLFVSKIPRSNMRIHMNMMGQMGHHMMRMGRGRSNMVGDDGNYNLQDFLLQAEGEEIGKVEVGYFGPYLVSDREVQFTKGINSSIIYGSIASVILAIIIGIFFSKIITSPITGITKVSNDLRKGKLNTRIKEKNNISELKELSTSINHLANSLQEQKMLRKRLTSDISHELRTPLTILQSHIEAMVDGVWEPSKQRLTVFKKEVDRLIKLVEQLKYLIDIEQHKIILTKDEFDLSQLLFDLLETFKYEFDNKKISLKSNIDKEINILADKDKLSQVILNLVSNALKFTEEGETVYVEAEKTKDKIRIIVEDTGIGMSKEDMPYIFERLYKADKSRVRNIEGSGIGLTITKKLIDAHKGTIEVESEKGEGTKFIITLPSEKNKFFFK